MTTATASVALKIGGSLGGASYASTTSEKKRATTAIAALSSLSPVTNGGYPMSQATRILSRRSFVQHSASLLAITPMVAFGVAAAVRPVEVDALLFAYGPKLKSLNAAYQDALHAHSVAEEAAFAAYPEEPTPSCTIGKGDIILDEAPGKVPSIRLSKNYNDQLAAGNAAVAAWRAECDGIAAERGVPEAEELMNDLCDQLVGLVAEMLSVRAQTIEGVRFKIEALGELDVPADNYNEEIAVDIAALAPRSVWAEGRVS